jgi:hypothetical protein
MLTKRYYLANPRIFIRRGEEDEGTTLFDPRVPRHYAVNDTALFIWGLCDGRHAEDDIVSEVSKEFVMRSARARHEIHAFLEDAIKADLLAVKNKIKTK